MVLLELNREVADAFAASPEFASLMSGQMQNARTRRSRRHAENVRSESPAAPQIRDMSGLGTSGKVYVMKPRPKGCPVAGKKAALKAKGVAMGHRGEKCGTASTPTKQRAALRKVKPSERLGLNVMELAQFAGILTDGLAEKVIKERTDNGRFRSWDELNLRIKGMGMSKIKTMQRAGIVIRVNVPKGLGKPATNFNGQLKDEVYFDDQMKDDVDAKPGCELEEFEKCLSRSSQAEDSNLDRTGFINHSSSGLRNTAHLSWEQVTRVAEPLLDSVESRISKRARTDTLELSIATDNNEYPTQMTTGTDLGRGIVRKFDVAPFAERATNPEAAERTARPSYMGFSQPLLSDVDGPQPRIGVGVGRYSQFDATAHGTETLAAPPLSGLDSGRSTLANQESLPLEADGGAPSSLYTSAFMAGVDGMDYLAYSNRQGVDLSSPVKGAADYSDAFGRHALPEMWDSEYTQ